MLRWLKRLFARFFPEKERRVFRAPWQRPPNSAWQEQLERASDFLPALKELLAAPGFKSYRALLFARAEVDLDALLRQQTVEETARLRGRLEAFTIAAQFPEQLVIHLTTLEEQQHAGSDRAQRWDIGSWGASAFQRRR